MSTYYVMKDFLRTDINTNHFWLNAIELEIKKKKIVKRGLKTLKCTPK
jgi:hypothetical protein